MWAWVVSLPVTLVNFAPGRALGMGPGGWAFAGLFVAGLTIEAVADHQVMLCHQTPWSPLVTRGAPPRWALEGFPERDKASRQRA